MEGNIYTYIFLFSAAPRYTVFDVSESVYLKAPSSSSQIVVHKNYGTL